MKKLAFLTGVVIFLSACGNQKNQNVVNTEEPQTAIVLTVDDLYQNAGNLVDKEVVVKGTVMHVCQQGGERLFLMGSNEDINIRVEAGEKIGAFKQEQMGSELEISGVLKQVKTAADAHNPGQQHGETEAAESAETANAHQVIADAQEAAEVVYFIEGIKVNKEL